MGYFKAVLVDKYYETLGEIQFSNIITEEGKDFIVNALRQDILNGWTYMAAGLGTTTPGSSDTALEHEIDRQPISGKYTPQAGTLTMVCLFGPYTGNGEWGEVGVFSGDCRRLILASCDTTKYMTSDGSLTSEGAEVMEGTASLGLSRVF